MDTKLGPFQSFICSAIAASFAEIVTLPLDTAKVRLFLSRQVAMQTGKPLEYTNVFQTILKMSKEEGVPSLFKGGVPGIHRQIIFGGLRLWLYVPIRKYIANNIMHEDEHKSGLITKMLSGGIAGAISMFFANPADLVKNRIQGSKGNVKIYKSAVNAYVQIVKKEGVLALWTGLFPNILRNSFMNAAAMATYDSIKQYILDNKLLEDGKLCHCACGWLTGTVSATIGNPIDIVKTRLMIQSKTEPLYKSSFDAF